MRKFVLRFVSDAAKPLYFVKATGIGPMTGPLSEAKRYETRDSAVDGMLGEARHSMCSWTIEETP